MADLYAPLIYVNPSTGDRTFVADPRVTNPPPTSAPSPGVIDVAAQYGTTVAHVQAAIEQAHTNAAALDGSPTVVYLDARTWNLNGVLYPKDGVTIRGAGRDKTILAKSGAGPALAYGSGAPSTVYDPVRPTPLRNFTLEDLTIDCEAQTTGQVSVWGPKGIFFVDVAALRISRVRVVRSHYTCFGIDYASEKSVIEDCIAEGSRNNNGFGIHSGGTEDEDLTVINCTALDVFRAGFLAEVHVNMTNAGRGARFIGCLALDCGLGFENAGVAAATFDSCISLRAKTSGFKFGEGDLSGANIRPTGHATMNNCFAIDTTGNGVKAYFDLPAVADEPALVIQNSVIARSTGAGVAISLAGYDVHNLTIRNNTIHDNGTVTEGGGIHIGVPAGTHAGKMVDVSIHGNDLIDNRGPGINLDADLTRGRIEGNTVASPTVGRTTYGLRLRTGRTATGTHFDGGRFDGATTPVDLVGTLTDCHVGHVPGWTRRPGAPTVKAPKGTVYQRTDGTAGTLLYVNTDGGTTWTAFA